MYFFGQRLEGGPLTIFVSHAVVTIQASFAQRKSKNMDSVADLFRELFIELNVVVNEGI